MNAFQYAIAEEKISKFKTLKSKDAFIRECIQELIDISPYSYIQYLPENKEAICNYYKCITNTLQTYDVERLPYKIQSDITHLQKAMVASFAEEEIEYIKFIDTFKFITVLPLSTISVKTLKGLNRIYKNYPITCQLKFTVSLSNKFRYILSTIYGIQYTQSSLDLCQVLQLEELKRELAGDIQFTILENTLNDYYNKLPIEIDTTNLITSMQDLVTIATTFKAKYNE